MDQPSEPSFESTFSSSSKTGSTITKSAVSTEKDRDMDLSKDNSASPIDLECHIQTERITKILDEAIYKTKLAICLPDLVAEYKTLNRVLSTTHMDDLIFIFDQYDNPLFSASILNMATVEDLKAGDLSLKNRLNPELGHLMYILNSYQELKATVVQMMQQKRKSKESRDMAVGMEFLNELEQFRDLMVKQMETTAADELLAKINTRKLEESNERLVTNMKKYAAILKEENERFEETMASKAQAITKLEHELSMLNYDSTCKLKRKILDSERQMVLASRAHVVKNEMLQEEELETRETYKHLLSQHLLEEKNQRARRFKVETQLLSWLQKYDLEMEDKQAELDEFTQKYETELDRCNKLQEALDEQDKEYIPLMEERETEYHQEMTKKMEAFRLERAAKIIQHYWREILANRAEKKRLKKLHRDMLIQQERAAIRAEKAQKAAEKAEKAAAKAARAEAKAEAKAAKAAEKAEKKRNS